MIVSAGGIASATAVFGQEFVFAGGIDIGSVVNSGGMEFIGSAATISGGWVYLGGKLTVSSGGVVSGGLSIAGTATISGTVVGGQSVTFAGSGADLALGNLAAFGFFRRVRHPYRRHS